MTEKLDEKCAELLAIADRESGWGFKGMEINFQDLRAIIESRDELRANLTERIKTMEADKNLLITKTQELRAMALNYASPHNAMMELKLAFKILDQIAIVGGRKP
jgi:hypothetical protein